MAKKQSNTKVTVSLGFTLLLNETTHEYVRPEIRIQEIDVSGDVNQQISDSLKVAETAWDAIIKKIIKRVSELKI